MSTPTTSTPRVHPLARAVLDSAAQAQQHPVAAAQLSSSIGEIHETTTLRVGLNLSELPDPGQDLEATSTWECWVELTVDEPAILTRATLCLHRQDQTLPHPLDPTGYLARMVYQHATA